MFGGALTALRYPERELVAVPAARVWFEPIRPLRAEPMPDTADARAPDELAVTDVLGKRTVTTDLLGRVTVPAENSAAALEVLSRFAMHPRWLVYLPPTMAPVATSADPALLERPEEAFEAYARDGVDRVAMQAKHMGSRAVTVVCRDAGVAARVFGADDGALGAVISRTGRALLAPPRGGELVERLAAAVGGAGLWDELSTDWLVLDAELLPWALPGRRGPGLVPRLYAPVAAAALADTAAVADVLAAAAARGVPVSAPSATWNDAPPAASSDTPATSSAGALATTRVDDALAFDAAWRRYAGIGEPVRLAPFCVLAGADQVYARRPVDWQLAVLDRLVAADPTLLVATQRHPVTLADGGSRAGAARWWHTLVEAGAGARSAVSARSPCASTHSGWRRCTASSAANRCGGCTRRWPACWRWSPSRSTLGSEPGFTTSRSPHRHASAGARVADRSARRCPAHRSAARGGLASLRSDGAPRRARPRCSKSEP